jgi:hypothetical protein
MANIVRIGDTTLFRLYIKDENNTIVDLSDTLIKKICFKSPLGVSIEQNASFLTDGKDGCIEYRVGTEEINKTGTWQIQGYISFANGQTWRTDISTFQVTASI